MAPVTSKSVLLLKKIVSQKYSTFSLNILYTIVLRGRVTIFIIILYFLLGASNLVVLECMFTAGLLSAVGCMRNTFFYELKLSQAITQFEKFLNVTGQPSVAETQFIIYLQLFIKLFKNISILEYIACVKNCYELRLHQSNRFLQIYNPFKIAKQCLQKCIFISNQK